MLRDENIHHSKNLENVTFTVRMLDLSKFNLAFCGALDVMSCRSLKYEIQYNTVPDETHRW